MLENLHLVVDDPPSKCCFSSTMKRDYVLLAAGILASVGLFSCATDPGGSMDSASPALSDSSSIWEYRPAPVRPGLATGWGKQKSSSVVGRSFERASSKPAGIDTIHYNNPAGIAAMTRRPSRVEGMQRAAGELVEWGVKGRGGYLPTFKESWGYGRRLVEGKKDATYEIVVKNRSRSTLEVVASVDGLDVQDGKTASFKKRGYLIDPGKTLTIDGFRTSNDSVARFKFSGVADSYANRKHGDTRNVGVIGLAVFTQKGVDPWTWMPGEVKTRNGAQAFAEAP